MKHTLITLSLLISLSSPAASHTYTCAELRGYLKQGYTVEQMEQYARSQGVSDATIARYKACLKP